MFEGSSNFPRLYIISYSKRLSWKCAHLLINVTWSVKGAKYCFDIFLDILLLEYIIFQGIVLFNDLEYFQRLIFRFVENNNSNFVGTLINNETLLLSVHIKRRLHLNSSVIVSLSGACATTGFTVKSS